MLWTLLCFQFVDAELPPGCKVGPSSKLYARSPAIATTNHRKKSTLQETGDGLSFIFRRSPALSDAERALVLKFGGKHLLKERIAAHRNLQGTLGLLNYVKKANDANWNTFRAIKAYTRASNARLLKSPFHGAVVFTQAVSDQLNAEKAFWNADEAAADVTKAYWDARRVDRLMPVTAPHFLKSPIKSTIAPSNSWDDMPKARAEYRKISRDVLNVASVNKDMRQYMERTRQVLHFPLSATPEEWMEWKNTFRLRRLKMEREKIQKPKRRLPGALDIIAKRTERQQQRPTKKRKMSRRWEMQRR